MILFVWSLFADAVSYVKRQKLSQAISMNLARPGSLLFRRLTLTSARSAPTPSSVVCRNDRIEIIYHENWIQLELNQWQSFDLVKQKLQSIAESPVYFVATMMPGIEDENKIRRAIEERCIPIAWRAQDNLDVLFGSSEKEFVDLICDWSENLILYRNFFDLTKLETVLLTVDFKNSLIFIPQTPTMIAQVANPSTPAHQSKVLKGLEQLCLKDILNAKDLCRNIATFTAPDWTSTNTSLTSSPQSPTISILVQPTSMKFHSGSTVSIPCKFSPIEEVPTISFSHQNLTTVNEDAGGNHQIDKNPEVGLINFDDDDDGEINGWHHRRSPCHGFNDRLVDRHHYRTSSRSSSMNSVMSEEPRRGSERKLTKSSLNLSDHYASLSRRFSLPSPNQTRSRSASSSIKFRRLSTITNHEKPPNVLIYCGSDDDANDGTFEKLRNSLRRSLNSSKYVVYRLKHGNFFKDPWSANTSCLVLADFKNLDERFWSKLFDYFRSGGKLLFLCENRLLSSLSDTNSAKKRFGLLKLAFDGQSGAINKEVEKFLKKLSKNLNSKRVCEQCHVKDADGRYKYTLSVLREINSPLIFYMQNSHERAGALFSDMTMDMFLNEGDGLIRQIVERLGLEIQEQPTSSYDLTSGYLLFEDENCLSMEIEKRLLRKGRFDGKLSLDFKDSPPNNLQAKDDYLPIHCSIGSKSYPKGFDGETYFSNLKSVTFGKSVLYVPIASSTMHVYDSLSRALPSEASFIVIADRQLNGLGRSGNQWLSPIGCAMFTLGYQTSLSVKPGQYAGFIQHIVALAVVDSICKLPSFETFDLRLKWPNDIYYGRTTKLGGVLVNCTVQGEVLKLNIGCGINVSNSAPTVCLNDLLPSSIEPFSREQVIALAVTRLEELLETFSTSGHEEIWPLYYKYWLHDHQELTVAETNERVTVRGLDRYGFLDVRSRQTGKAYSLQPDGNSLDMMHNLIKVKS